MTFIEEVVDSDIVQISGNVGDKWVVIATNRSGATTFGVTPNPTGSAWSNVIVASTTPTNEEQRRAVAIAELSVQQNFTDVTFTAAFNTGGTSCVWYRVDTDYSLEEVISANSGGSTVTAQSTGTTPSVGAGNILAVTGISSRGGWATRSWNNADIQPGTNELVADVGDNEFTNACAAGYRLLASQPSQTYSDQFNVGSARMMTAVIAIFLEAAPSEPQDLNIGFHEQINTIFAPTLQNQSNQNLSIGFLASGSQIFVPTIENQDDLNLAIPFKASSSVVFQLTANNEGDQLFEPLLLGNGSLADQIMAGLIDQGFLVGSLVDREYLRLLSKLSLAYTGTVTITDLYRLADEPDRLSGLVVPV